MSKKEKNKDVNKEGITIFSFIKEEKAGFIASIILSVLGGIAQMLPYLMGVKIICSMYLHIKEPKVYIGFLLIAMAGYFTYSICRALSTLVSHNATFRVLYKIRVALIEKLKRVPLGYILETSSGTLKNILVDRVEGLEQYLAHYISELTANLLVPFLIFIYLFTINWKMTLIMFLPLPAVIFCCWGMMQGFDEKLKKFYAAKDAVNDAVIEYVNGIEVIKTFNRSVSSYKKYSEAVYNNAKFGYEWQKGAQGYLSAAICILHSTMLTILPFGYWFWNRDKISVEVLLTFIILAIGLMTPLIKAMFMFETTTKMEADFEKIKEILESEELVRTKQENRNNKNDIVIDHLRFSYGKDENSKEVLHDININIKEGTVTAFVGPSGSGKSTIVKLLAGFWDASNGEIRIGGIPMSKMSQKDINSKIAYVSQDNFLVNYTVMENIRVGNKNASDEEVIKAAKKCGCHEFIMGLENGYQTVVGTAGGHLSGGERQRITIVRAMLKDAPIIILDEATSYTDPENEAVLQSSISKFVKDKTLIVIAHRLATVADADQIVLINSGKVEYSGTHDELYKNSDLYHEMWDANMGVRQKEMEGLYV